MSSSHSPPFQTTTTLQSTPTQNNLNVYRGPDALCNYYNPDIQPPLPLVEIPDSLNSFTHLNVHIYAKMMTMLPAHNVKALPAIKLLQDSIPSLSVHDGNFTSNSHPKSPYSIVEYSSGSTVTSMSIAARIFHNINEAHAYVSNKTNLNRLRLLQFFGLNITLFGGPSQPNISDPRGGVYRAAHDARINPNLVNPCQYTNDANWRAHYEWTGPQILRQLPEITVVCAGMGTSGTMTGIGCYFKKHKPSVHRVGVCTAPGDRVPGPRTLQLLQGVNFPWRDAIDTVEQVTSPSAFSLSLRLSRCGIVCGPSSGLNLQGLIQFIEKRANQGTLDELRGPDGCVHCVFICCDLPFQYMEDYYSKLGDTYFNSIKNDSLLGVDTYRYDDDWERHPHDLIEEAFSHNILRDGFIIIDLRQPEDFSAQNIPGSINLPLVSLKSNDPSPFDDPQVLRQQWLELMDMLVVDNSTKNLSVSAKSLATNKAETVTQANDNETKYPLANVHVNTPSGNKEKFDANMAMPEVLSSKLDKLTLLTMSVDQSPSTNLTTPLTQSPASTILSLPHSTSTESSTPLTTPRSCDSPSDSSKFDTVANCSPSQKSSITSLHEPSFPLNVVTLQSFKKLILVCYTGDTSRIATSILRAHNLNADSSNGGWHALHQAYVAQD